MSYRTLVGNVCFFFFCLSLNALTDRALAGGDSKYLAVIDLDTGIASSVTGDLPIQEVTSVSMAPGFGLVGGGNYLSLVDLNTGIATNVTGITFPSSPFSATIKSVSINSSGRGIAAVDDQSSGSYFVQVLPSGSAIPVIGATNYSDGSVSINEDGTSLIGASYLTNSAVQVVSSSGVVTDVTGSIPAILNDIAINNSNEGLIIGQLGASRVSSSKIAAVLTGSPPAGGFGVAINDSGVGVVVGYDNVGQPYIGKVSASGVASAFTNSAGGILFAVGMNESEEIIAGGENGYLALFSSTGVETIVTGDTASQSINSVAINNAGISIAGGDGGYLALISPTGVAVNISGDVPSGTKVRSVGILESAALPEDTGAVDVANNFVIPVFSLSSQTLPGHMVSHRNQGMAKLYSQGGSGEVAYLADAGEIVQDANRIDPTFQRDKMVDASSKEAPFSIWGSPFGNYAIQKKDGRFPAAKISSAGAMLGFDYLGVENGLVGTGAAYAYHYVSVDEKQGHAKTHQALFSLYGSKTKKYFYANMALWAGPYWTENTRHSLMGRVTSTSNIDGWLLVPHFEMSFPFYAKQDWCIVDPFMMFDWANNWQGEIHEKGASGFNINVGSQYISILRSEGGLRFFERVDTSWGSVSFTEKVSYVNKKPFGDGRSTAFFTGAASSFGIDVFNSQVQNLGVVQFSTEFTPNTTKYPYGSITYQGEFGSSFQTHFCSFEIGKNF